MPVLDLNAWIERWAVPGTVWFAKRLSGNDTLANGSHQAGPYIPKEFLFRYFPSINTREQKNPDTTFDLYIDSHPDHKKVRLVYYNNKFFLTPEEIKAKKNGRNETRITNLGGGESALLNPDSTGALTAFVFVLDDNGLATECHVWVCENLLEEELLESDIGPAEPKQFVVWQPGGLSTGLEAYLTTTAPIGPISCRLAAADIPTAWLRKFPTGEEIVQKTRDLRPDNNLAVDDRLIRRRNCEFEVFRSVEEAFYLPRITSGFSSLVDFLAVAQTILQSRKSRSGKSLEFHARDIFKEEALVAETHFSHSPTIEGNKKPDFLFPSVKAYNDTTFPKGKLRMLAAKTTLKDRWRQITQEADRIETKHLLTLQEGVSENQFREMCEANVKLVVPTKLHDSYPKSVKPHLISLESFIAEVRMLTV
jgi:hypothetical protein